ncbi:MAG: HelD family protein [Acidimicrobiales bacterium]
MDAELEAEQAYVDNAYGYLSWMRDRALGLVAGTDPKELDLLHALKRRAASLTDGGRPLCFGRIDQVDGTTFHVGRRHVEDHQGDPVVVEWRAPVAVPFYRANPKVPMGLSRRRQFVIDGRRIQSMADDAFDAGGDVPRLRGGDVLLAELERGRGPEMLDIVATIQAEQDEVIRAPLAGVLVVQGGPGSGKTAVGLHRAAFLLYGEEELARRGVLVLGPNRIFLRYIAQVLPSLGEEAVVQTTVRDLAPGLRVIAEDDAEAERTKGDARMAQVLAGALAGGRRPLEADVVVGIGLRRLVVAAADATAMAAQVAQRRLAYEVGRGVLRDLLVDALVAPVDTDRGRAEQVARASPALTAALDRLWPSVTPTGLVRSLITNRAALSRAAAGILTAGEQRSVLRPARPTSSLEVRTAALPLPAWELRAGRKPAKPKRRDPWTAADVALLDEAVALITGDGRTYGHVIVDEAQDLSPMQLRMIGRRAPGGSVTLLGDLAQASGSWSHERWEQVVEHLAVPDGWRIAELRLGYRSPADVIELASRLLPIAAPGVAPPEAVRERRGAVSIVTAVGALADAAAAAAVDLAARYGSVAVISPDRGMDALEAAAARAGLDAGRAEHDGLARPVALVEARQAKGLEFDAVVVVDPAGIVDSAADRARGLRLLYVALTRPTQALTVVHNDDLPAPLARA